MGSLTVETLSSLLDYFVFSCFQVENSENLLQVQTVLRPAKKRGGRCTRTRTHTYTYTRTHTYFFTTTSLSQLCLVCEQMKEPTHTLRVCFSVHTDCINVCVYTVDVSWAVSAYVCVINVRLTPCCPCPGWLCFNPPLCPASPVWHVDLFLFCNKQFYRQLIGHCHRQPGVYFHHKYDIWIVIIHRSALTFEAFVFFIRVIAEI